VAAPRNKKKSIKGFIQMAMKQRLKKKPQQPSLYKPAHQAFFAAELRKQAGISEVIVPVSPLTTEQKIQKAIDDITMPSIPLDFSWTQKPKNTPIRTLTTPPRSAPQLTVTALNAINLTKTPPTPTFTSSPLSQVSPIRTTPPSPTNNTQPNDTPNSTPKDTPSVSSEGFEPSDAPPAEEKKQEISRAEENVTRDVTSVRMADTPQNFQFSPYVADPPRTFIGFVCHNEKFEPADTIVFGGGCFFRLAHPLPFALPLPLTPIQFSTNWGVEKKFGPSRHSTFRGLSPKIFLADEHNAPPTPFLEGSFEKFNSEKLSFSWDCNGLLDHPVRLTSYLSSLPKNIALGRRFRVQVAVKTLVPQRKNQAASPYFQTITPLEHLNSLGIFSEPTNHSLLPPDFLKAVASDPLFGTHIVIGLPENEVVPTFPFVDFCRLSASNSLSWPGMEKILYDKYTGDKFIRFRGTQACERRKDNAQQTQTTTIHS
jgi:hypothetical protein